MEIINDDEFKQKVATKGQPNQPRRQIPLTNFQKALLTAFQSKPETMKLLQAVFKDYPEAILQEHAYSRPTATRKQQQTLNQVRNYRLRIEAYIEETIAKLSGIEVDKLKLLDKKSKSDDGTSD